jgi:hypothetical protein
LSPIRARTSLESALADKPWALTGVLLTMADVHDVAGRPLGERRASADAKRGVPFELKACPYRDEREGRPMNASALAPTMRHFAAVADAVGALHAALPPGEPSWSRMLAAVMDRLAAPALHLLRLRSLEGPVPEDVSSGHKLAAGFFGALQQLLRSEIADPVSRRATNTDNFAAFVHARGSLIGASEVCAGAPGSIAKLTDVFVRGQAEPAGTADATRVTTATLLAAQITLGLVWQLLDETTEQHLLVEPMRDGWLAPKTRYLGERIQTRLDALAERPVAELGDLVDGLPGDAAESELARLLARGTEGVATDAERAVVHALLDTSDVAIELRPPGARDAICERLTVLLVRYRGFVAEQWRLEQKIRDALGYSPLVGMKTNALLFPTPRALEWLEIFTGHRLQCTPAADPELVLRNHHRVVTFA